MERSSCVLFVLMMFIVFYYFPAGRLHAEESEELKQLRQLVNQLVEKDEQRDAKMKALENTVQELRNVQASKNTEIHSDLDMALAKIEGKGSSVERQGVPLDFKLSSPNSNQHIDISANVLTSVGTSTEDEDTIQTLQGGAHDPKKRGFTLQQLELSLTGAIDHYLLGEAHIIYAIDALTGDSVVELEEAFATAPNLPLNMELEAGLFYTEFGRLNPLHPDAWKWQDMPVVNSRFFGGDGLRAPGARLGWLLPTPWYSQIHLGVQNANGETVSSFLGEQEGSEFGHAHGEEEEGGHGFEEGIGGRPLITRRVDSLKDMLYLARWENSMQVNEEVNVIVGTSHLFGPNSTGNDGSTYIGGADFTLKWRPNRNMRGYPFISWQSEVMNRHFRSDRYSFLDEDEDPPELVPLGHRVLRDWGLYSEVLWGFRKDWAIGMRFDYADGSKDNVEFEEEEGAEPQFVDVSRGEDHLRNERFRLSPMLEWMPSEFTRVRFQYNWDHAEHLDDKGAHSLWLGLQFLWGKHPPHKY